MSMCMGIVWSLRGGSVILSAFGKEGSTACLLSVNGHFSRKRVAKVAFDAIRDLMGPPEGLPRSKIGFHAGDSDGICLTTASPGRHQFGCLGCVPMASYVTLQGNEALSRFATMTKIMTELLEHRNEITGPVAV